MIDNTEDIQKFLDSIPDKFNILEEGVDMQTQIEYINHSHSFDRRELTEEETIGLGKILLSNNIPIEGKKKALGLLAHLGTIAAFRQIEKYNNHPDNELKQWTLLSLQECKMFLEGSLLDESMGFISSGLGGIDNRLRYYFLVLPLTNQLFTNPQKDIIKNEFILVCKDLNSILETIDLSNDAFVSITLLMPLDIALGTVIETGIKKCNDLGTFVFEYYYATNQNIPDLKEIDNIIKIVRED